MSDETVQATKRCSKCGEEKAATVQFWTRHPDAKLGLYPQCKVCKYAVDRAYRAARAARAGRATMLPLPQARECTKCGVRKPRTAEFWHPHKYSRDGFGSWCRECKRNANRISNRARRRSGYTIKVRSDDARFWALVQRGDASECWPFIGSRNRGGYGQAHFDGDSYLAHRVALARYKGVPPAKLKLMVLHRCDNPPCCNPTHLFEGTNRDNMLDMVAKGRRNSTAGEHHPYAKVTEKQAIGILAEAAAGTKKSELARKYGVGYSCIHGIVSGTSWKHLRRLPANPVE